MNTCEKCNKGGPHRHGCSECESLCREKRELELQNQELQKIIDQKPECNTVVPPEFQRFWEACVRNIEKADFKLILKYVGRLEGKVKESDRLNLLYKSALDWICGHAHIRGLKDIEARCEEVTGCAEKRNDDVQRLIEIEEALGREVRCDCGVPGCNKLYDHRK